MKMYNTRGALLTSNEGNLRSYDTGWIACSTWTNQHLGTALGGNVVHNLNTPLRNLMVKVFISTNGTDDTSFEVVGNEQISSAPYGITIDDVDDDNIIVQTATNGIITIISDGTATVIDTESWYYRIVVYEMSTVYSGVAMELYETPWINRNLWNNKHLGSSLTKNLDSNVTHNLNTPLSDLMVKLLVSPTGVDGDSFELIVGADDGWGVTVYYVDANNILVQTGASGIIYINATGGSAGIDTEDWYYKIKVYKLTAQPPAIITSRCRAYKATLQGVNDGGWQQIELDTTEFDSLGEFDVTTNAFTVKNSGYYQVNGCVTIVDLTDGKEFVMAIRVNGVQKLGYYTTAGKTWSISTATSGVLYLATGDVLTLWAAHFDTTTRNTGPAYTWFDIHRLS